MNIVLELVLWGGVQFPSKSLILPVFELKMLKNGLFYAIFMSSDFDFYNFRGIFRGIKFSN